MRKIISFLFFVLLVNSGKSQNYGYSWHATNYGWLGSNGTTGKLYDDEKGTLYSATQGFLSTPQLLVQKKDMASGNPLYNIIIQDPGMAFTNPYCRNLKTDDAGNLYIVGTMSGSSPTLDFDPSFANYNLSSLGTSDFIAKYSPSGTFLYAFITNESISDFAFDSQGSIYTVGTFSGSVDFNWSAATNTLTSNGAYDIFIAKYNSSGQYIRAYNIGSANYEYGKNIINDGSDKFIIAGTFSNTPVDFDPKATSYILTSQGGSDLYLARYDSIFNFNWANNIGGTGAEDLYKMDKENKKVQIVAYFNSPIMDVDISASTLNLSTSGPYKYAMISYDTSRVLQFGYALDFAPISPGWVMDVDLNSKGNLAVVGNYTSAIDADIGPGVATMSMVPSTPSCCPQPQDFFLGVYNASGYKVAYAFGAMPGANNGAYCVTFNSNDEIVMGGTDLSVNSYKFDFDPSPSIASAPTSSGFNHGFVAKYGYCTAGPTGTVSAIVGPTLACINTAFVIQTYSITPVSGASNYSWTAATSFTGNPTMNTYDIYFYGGSGTIQVQPFNACGTSTIIQTLSITVNPNPTVTTSISNSLICTGQTSTLTANGALTYSWSTGSTNSTTTISPTTTTNYTVTGTDANGCMDTDTITQYVSACTGINTFTKTGFQIYPNPTSGELIIKSELKENLSLEIYSIIGQLILKQKITELETKIDLKEKSNGIYFIKVIEEGKTLYQSKIIKE